MMGGGARTDLSSVIGEALGFIPSNDRDIWYRVASAIKTELGEEGFPLWDDWSQRGEGYDPKSSRDTWKCAEVGGRVTISTVFYFAKKYGWKRATTYKQISSVEFEERRRIAGARQANEAAKIARERANAAVTTGKILGVATLASASNQYLSRKNVDPTLTLKEIDVSVATSILGYPPAAKGERLMGQLLVVQVLQGDTISTVELIDGSGRKTALFGRGTKAGGYWPAQTMPETDGPEPLAIGEGVATVLSAQKATGHLAVASLSGGNLPSIAKAMRERYPTRPLVILADLVKATGMPDSHAIEAARAVGGRLAVPSFGTDRPESATDFNDMAALHGLEAVRAAIVSATTLSRSVQVEEKLEAASWVPPCEISNEEWLNARAAPDCIVENLFFADVGVLIAAGATGKTTLMLFMAIHVVLGRSIFGLRVKKSGPVVIFTAEDSRESLVARLKLMAVELGLSDAESAKVRSSIRISDVSGVGFKLAEITDNVVMPNSVNLDKVTAWGRTLNPVLILVDPAISFGVGESRVNDAEQGLVGAARRLRNDIRCCILFVHHTGKVNGREGAIDQYAGRGGSAFADGCRMVHVLVSVSPEEWRKETGEDFKVGESGLKLARPKLSFVPKQPPILIRRTGFSFEAVDGISKDKGSILESSANQIWQLLSEELKSGRRHTKNTLEALGVAGMTRVQIRAGLSWLESNGRIESREWPTKQKNGARQYLHPVDSENGFAGQEHEPVEENSTHFAAECPFVGSPPPIGNASVANHNSPTCLPSPCATKNVSGEPVANSANRSFAGDAEIF